VQDRTALAPDTLSASPVLGLGLTWNFFQHLFLWKYRLRMRSMVELEKIIWRTSKVSVFGNGYNIVLATKPSAPLAGTILSCRSSSPTGPTTA
jgi:hypothetical protein